MNKVFFLRFIFFTFVIISISIIYYVKVIEGDYEVFTNPDGPDTSDYFLLEE